VPRPCATLSSPRPTATTMWAPTGARAERMRYPCPGSADAATSQSQGQGQGGAASNIDLVTLCIMPGTDYESEVQVPDKGRFVQKLLDLGATEGQCSGSASQARMSTPQSIGSATAYDAVGTWGMAVISTLLGVMSVLLVGHLYMMHKLIKAMAVPGEHIYGLPN